MHIFGWRTVSQGRVGKPPSEYYKRGIHIKVSLVSQKSLLKIEKKINKVLVQKQNKEKRTDFR